MTAKMLTSIVRPDDDREQRVLQQAWHKCNTTKSRERLFFPVGAAGFGHPSNSPFEVMSLPCEHCDIVVTCYFQWVGATIFDLGAL